MEIIETAESRKKQVLSKEDIIAIRSDSGSPTEVMKRHNITRQQYKYIFDNYDEDGKLLYRRNLYVNFYD